MAPPSECDPTRLRERVVAPWSHGSGSRLPNGSKVTDALHCAFGLVLSVRPVACDRSAHPRMATATVVRDRPPEKVSSAG